jgi:predicted nucleic acid-binding protein
MPVAPGLTTLDALSELVRTVEIDDYAPMEALARQRLARRDEDDWPILAAALALRCPIWTEDGLLVCANLGRRRLSGGQAG